MTTIEEEQLGSFFTETCALVRVEADVAHIAVVDGPNAGSVFPFVGESATVGSGPAADLRLADRAVSRLHCQLTREGQSLRLRDLGSKNGTWLAGHRVDDALLGPGARIKLGLSVLETRIERAVVQKAKWRGGARFGPLIGASPRMQDLFARLARVVDHEARVLITGESGTGKELVARALHEHSARRAGPFVVVDGAALSRSLADLELFGHVPGAFTGATGERAGAFERAHGGTLFLDEVGELPPDVQPKLLRALETGTIQRLGDERRRAVDVRVIAATHRSLPRLVNESAFREDLYYRLAVVELEVPPLRERGRDVQLLARALLDEIAPGRCDIAAALDRALEANAGYRWPGNVRELRSFVRRFALLGDSTVMPAAAAEDDASRVRVDLPFGDAKQRWLETFERQYLAAILDETGGNLSEASRRAGLARSRMHELVVRYGLRRVD